MCIVIEIITNIPREKEALILGLPVTNTRNFLNVSSEAYNNISFNLFT